MKSIGLLFALIANTAIADCVADVSLHSGAGWTVFETEVVATKSERAQGLMNRTSMPYASAMVFLYPDAAPRSFWMKDTPLPLDIMFFDDKLKLVSVAKNTEPFSEAPIAGGDNISVVMEVNAGIFDDLGFGEKTRIRLQDFKGDTCPDWIFNDQPFSPKD